jgi:RNA polymerase sigma-70 factor, ECF subfamily
MPDVASFEVFYRENLPRIVRACALVTLDRALAEDVADEAFIRAWSKWDIIQNHDHAGGFVFKTAMRQCARELRKRARRPPSSNTAHTDPIERALVSQDLFDALSALPARQRQAVVLRDWAGFDTRDVARLMSTRESTVRVHLARGRESLRASLGERSNHEDR